MILLGNPGGATLLACNAVSFLAANMNSCFGNRTWIFPGQRNASFGEFGVFLTIAYTGLLINSSVLWTVTGGAPSSLIHLNLAKVAATVVSMGWNFCGYKGLFRSH